MSNSKLPGIIFVSSYCARCISFSSRRFHVDVNQVDNIFQVIQEKVDNYCKAFCGKRLLEGEKMRTVLIQIRHVCFYKKKVMRHRRNVTK